MPGFIENWVEDSARDRVVRETDQIQSEWPAHSGSAVASGFRAPTVGSASILLDIPSSRMFKPRTLWITNNNLDNGVMNLYMGGSAGDASATIGGIRIGAVETQFIAIDGITLGGGDIYVSAELASMEIRIAGLLLRSCPE